MESHALLDQARQHFQQGELEQAEAYCAETLKDSPNHPDAWCLQGMIARQQGNHPAAVQFISKAVELQPQNTSYWNHLGLAVQELGHRQDAINMYRQGLQFNPGHGESLMNLAQALAAEGNATEAERCFQQALEAEPDNATHRDAYAYHLACHGQRDAAIQQWGKALQSDPTYWPAAFKLGVFHFEIGNLAQAINQLEQAIRLQPLDEKSYFYLAHAHRRKGQPDLELATYRRLIEQAPNSVFGHTRLGVCYETYGDLENARAIYGKLAELQPTERALWQVREASLLTPIPQSNDTIDAERANLLETLRTARQETQHWTLAQAFEARCYVPSTLVYQGRDDLELKSDYADWLVESLSIPVHHPRLLRADNRKIRVGFLLTENHEGVFQRVMSGYLKFLDRERFDLQVICPTARQRTMQALLADIPDLTYLPLGEIEQSVAALQNAQLDVLFYFEIGTDPRNYLLSLHRFAPVQCTSWGFPSTSGSPNMDYYISSRLTEPEHAQSQYREQLLLMDSLPCYFYKPVLPERYLSRAELGLPEQQKLYVCAQTLIKFHPDFDAALYGILDRDPNAEIVLVEGGKTLWTHALQARLKESIPQHLDRIRFLPRLTMDEYLSLLNAANVVLDTPHFGGGLTTYETLAVGTPLVTWTGSHMQGRYGAGCYAAMGISEPPVAATTDEFVTIATRIANEPSIREHLKQAILAHNAVLFEDMNAIRHLETLLLEMVQAAEQRP